MKALKILALALALLLALSAWIVARSARQGRVSRNEA